MASAERNTFYDEHPFDWALPEAGTDIRSVVSPVLVDLIEGLQPND